MSHAQRIVLVLIALVLLGGLGGATLWLLRESPRAAPVVVAPPESPARDTEPAPPAESVHLAIDPVHEYTALDTTVAFPLEVELELVRARDTPRADGVAPLGTGATARLKGSILDMRGEGVRAQVEFVAGTNQGRVLYCDRGGTFGANDLYPGISVVRVSGGNIQGSMREVRLRQDRDSLLNIAYGRPAHVFGQVYDSEGKLVAGAKVTMDGQVATTNDEGVFEFTNMTGGEVLCFVEKEGFAPYRETLSIALATKVDVGRFKFLLQRGARLQVTLADKLNAGQQAQLFLLPEVAEAQRKFPWQRVNPTPIWPGGTATLEDLPGGPVTLRVFHVGANAKPPRSTVVLSPGDTSSVTLHMEPAPVIAGVVTDGGKPAQAAIVRLEVPDRTAAMLATFGEANYMYLESDVLPNLPPAVQEARTDARGEFTLAANENVSGVRYVTAVSADGRRTASLVLRGGETSVELALQPVQDGQGELVVLMAGRIQPLPVRVAVNAEPRDERYVAPREDLRVERLPPGAWLATVRWHGEVLVNRAPIEIQDEATLTVQLPEGAIFGQDEDTLLRAGKRPRPARNGEK